MPRRIIRNAIHLDALPATVKVAGKRAATTRKKASPSQPATPAKPKTAKPFRPTARRIMPDAFYKPLPGETKDEQQARLRAEFYADLQADGFGPWEGEPFGKEHQFALATHKRKWAADLAWPSERICVEIEGFGHQKDNRYYTDILKYNTAATLGWLLIRVTYDMLADGRALPFVKEAFAYRRTQAA